MYNNGHDTALMPFVLWTESTAPPLGVLGALQPRRSDVTAVVLPLEWSSRHRAGCCSLYAGNGLHLLLGSALISEFPGHKVAHTAAERKEGKMSDDFGFFSSSESGAAAETEEDPAAAFLAQQESEIAGIENDEGFGAVLVGSQASSIEQSDLGEFYRDCCATIYRVYGRPCPQSLHLGRRILKVTQ